MHIGIPKETKADERRVALLPDAVSQLCAAGHRVVVQRDAGHGIGIEASAWELAGAYCVDSAEEVWAQSALIVKVKEPQAAEWPLMRPGQIVFGFFHFAPDPELTQACLDQRITALAFETLRANNLLPLLRPMSEIAGRLSIQFAARCLEAPHGGPGILLGGIGGVAPAVVVILGGGIAGEQAARVACGMGASVFVLEKNQERIRALYALLPQATIIASTPATVATYCQMADVVVGCVLVAGARAPQLIDRSLLATMRPGCVLVDIAIDQGGCAASSRATTHQDPTFTVDGIIHCCVANMPGAVARTASQALSAVVGPYALDLANNGVAAFCALSPGHQEALNLDNGQLIHPCLQGETP